MAGRSGDETEPEPPAAEDEAGRPGPDRFRALELEAYDAIVVGAGAGGLTAAALLARRGRSVLVLDQHYVAGGAATVFRRPGYEFDIGLHYVGDCGPQGLIPRILRAAGADGVRFLELDPDGFETYRFPDFEFRVPRGLDTFGARLLERFPAEAAGIHRYLELLREAGALLQGPEALAGPAGPGAGAGLRLALRWATATVGEFLDGCTKDPRLRAVLTGQQGDYGQPPSRAALLFHALLVAHYAAGAYYPEGGGQVPADRLAASIERHGGKILLRARVLRFLVERGRAVGVELHSRHLGRRTVRAPVIVANADLKRTLLELIDPAQLRPATLARTRTLEMSPGLATLYLGVRRDLMQEGLRRSNYWVFPGYDPEPLYQAAAEGRFVEEPPLYLSLTSLKDPDNRRLAPPGVCNLQLLTVVPAAPAAWGVTGAEAESGAYRRAPGYLQAKQRLTARLLAGAERVLPGLRGDVMFHELSTPLTHARYTLASAGTPYGLALVPSQSLHRRPGPRTEIEGLYLCGASTRTGPGILGVLLSGLAAAAEIVGPGLMHEVLAAGAPPLTAPPDRRTVAP